MKKQISKFITTFILTLFAGVAFSQTTGIPHLQKKGTATQLIVDGKPFLMLGGELGNSSSSNTDYMNSIWPTLEKLNLNTVLAPVYWELIEPQEGKFDFYHSPASQLYGGKRSAIANQLAFVQECAIKNSSSS